MRIEKMGDEKNKRVVDYPLCIQTFLVLEGSETCLFRNLAGEL